MMQNFQLVLTLEKKTSGDQIEQERAQTKNIALGGVPVSTEYLRCNIAWSAASVINFFNSFWNNSGQAEVSDLNAELFLFLLDLINEDVVQLNVSVNYSLRVNVIHGKQQLCHHYLSLFFSKPFESHYLFEQGSLLLIFQNKVNKLFVFKDFKQLHHAITVHDHPVDPHFSH